METREISLDGDAAQDRAGGRRALAALGIVVLALLISCVAMMLIDWTSPRAAPAKAAPAETIRAPTPRQ